MVVENHFTTNIKEFICLDDEDANVWLRDILMISRLARLSEKDEILRAAISKLRDSALSGVSELVEQRELKINLDEFFHFFKRGLRIFVRLSGNSVSSLLRLLQHQRRSFPRGIILFEQILMDFCALAQVLIRKCPDNIKSLFSSLRTDE